MTDETVSRAEFEQILETLDLDHELSHSETQTFRIAEPAVETTLLLPEARRARARTEQGLEMLGTLGEGGVAVVHLARQLALQREVAVKTPHADAGENARASVLHEAYVTGRLEHPNIVPVYTLGSDNEGSPRIVMKRIEGTSWAEVLDGRIPVQEPAELARHLDILLQVCSAVRFAHSRGVVHRDIKPANVMIGDFDEVYLVDWGLSVDLPNETTDRSVDPEHSLAGTPGYMAPEMTGAADLPIDIRTDVYLLGATLHRLLTGDARHAGEVLFEVIYNAWKSEPFDYGEDVPQELAEVANRACSREPADRFESVDAFRDAIVEFRQHRASIELSAQTHERLDVFRDLIDAPHDADDETTLHDLFGECRFGFAQALRMWAENEQARSGLQTALTVMTRHYLDLQNLAGARACLAQLPDSDLELESEVEALATRRAAEGEEIERLKRLESDLDLRTGAVMRSWLALVLGLFWAGSTFLTAWREATREIPDDVILERHFLSGVRNIGIVLVIFVVFRKLAFVNKANRKLMFVLASMVLSVTFIRFAVWYTDGSIVLSRAANEAVFGFAVVVVGLMSDTRVSALGLLFYLSAVVGLLWPVTQVWASGIATLLFFSSITMMWRWSVREAVS